MTATEELRRLLDERGVEYTGTHPAFTAWWGSNDLYWSAMEVYDGELDLGTSMSNVSPEQAIVATLGSGTCHIKEVASYGYPFECSACKAWYGVDVLRGELRFCPNCGRKVVDE